MKKTLKFIFPLFKERHYFLLKKWWVRLAIVVYILAFFLLPFIIFALDMNLTVGWCYDSLPYGKDQKVFNAHLEECQTLARGEWISAISFSMLGTIALHYMIQLLLFKIIIDFIALGTVIKTKPS